MRQHICWDTDCTALPAPDLISGGSTATYGDHPAPCTPVGSLGVNAEACWGERWGCSSERWRGHTQPGPALPSLRGCVITLAMLGMRVERHQCHVPQRQKGWGRHAPACCHPASQQHWPMGDSGKQHSLTWHSQDSMSYWTILCCTDVTPCGLINLLLLSVPLTFPSLNLSPQSRPRKLGISLQELETP